MNFKLPTHPIHNAAPLTAGMNRRWQSKTADLTFPRGETYASKSDSKELGGIGEFEEGEESSLSSFFLGYFGNASFSMKVLNFI